MLDGHSQKDQKYFSSRISLNAGQKYKGAFCNTFDLYMIKLPVVIKTFVLSIFEWPFYTGFTVCEYDTYLS